MNTNIIRTGSFFIIFLSLLFIFIFFFNENRCFCFENSESAIRKDEKKIWVKKENNEIRRMGFHKEKSFMMECKDPELEEFRENYLKNADREGVDKEFAREELRIMYWEYDCYWTKYQSSKFYFVKNGFGARYHGYTVKEYSSKGDLLSSDDITIIPKVGRHWDRLGRYVLAWGIDYDGLSPFHVYDLHKRLFMRISYNPTNQGVEHTLTKERHTAAAISQNGRLAIVQNHYIWIFDPDQKETNLNCKMRFKPKRYVKKINALAFIGENELIIADNENWIIKLYFILKEGHYFIRWFRNDLLPQNNKIHGISLSSSGIAGVYSPFAVRFLSTDTGSPVSSTFKLEKNLSKKDGIRHLIWLDDGSPAIDLGAYWLVRNNPLINSTLKGHILQSSLFSYIFSRIEMKSLFH